MKIISTKCRLNQLSKKQIDSLIEAMPKHGLFDFGQGEGLIGFSSLGRSGTWVGNSGDSLISYTEMMQLLGKTMQFTKSDLKTGMFVKYRDGKHLIVLEDRLVGGTCYTKLSDVQDNLLAKTYSQLDIMAVYRVLDEGVLTGYMLGKDLALLWKRTEQTPAQKEMEELQAQISKLQDQAKVLQSKL
jgi:hypothetical protein